jgi:Spy/CpxP family protein refolding chaperone
MQFHLERRLIVKKKALGWFVVTLFASTALFVSIAWAQDEAAREHLLHELGGPFFVSREKVQEELKLSVDQKQKLREKLSDDVQETKKVLSLKAGEREKAMRSLRQRSCKKLEVFLKEILTPQQLKRFQQLELQYDTPAVMLRPEIGDELKITDEQRKQFMGLVQMMQKEMEPLIKGSRSGGNPQEILPKVIKMRQDCQGKIEALLSDAQKKRWKEMTGKPFVIW